MWHKELAMSRQTSMPALDRGWRHLDMDFKKQYISLQCSQIKLLVLYTDLRYCVI